ncbi:YaeQ family protein, partial [Shewanella sp.]|uniref:YaeQ family protein n=1 Tax=Shewanella sp. TaxID=50422 RepID=UPI003568F3E9
GLDGQYRLWVEFGLADEKRIKRASHRADKVLVCAYGGQDLTGWWKQHQGKYERIGHLQVLAFSNQQLDATLPFVERGMHLAVTIDEEGGLLISNGRLDLSLQPQLLKQWQLR